MSLWSMGAHSVGAVGLMAATAAGTMIVLDGLWLGYVASDFYRGQLGPLLARQPVWSAAIAFYVLYVAGLTTFVLLPALLDGRGISSAALCGAAFGLVCYGTYDLTNLATTQGFPPTLAFVDMVWGALMSAAMTVVALSVVGRFEALPST